MTSAIEKQERALEDLAHAQRIADAMAPDPREWEWTGEVNDAGPGASMMPGGPKCACGHPIRYQFPLERERDGARVVIGSTCIESTVPYLIAHGAEGLARRLEEALAAHREALAEQERREKAAAANEAVAQLAADWDELVAWRQRAGQRYTRRLPECLYYLRIGRTEAVLSRSAASTPARTAAALRTRYANTWLDVFRCAQTIGGEHAPVPREPKLREKLIKEARAKEAQARRGLERGVEVAHYQAKIANAQAVLAALGAEV